MQHLCYVMSADMSRENRAECGSVVEEQLFTLLDTLYVIPKIYPTYTKDKI